MLYKNRFLIMITIVIVSNQISGAVLHEGTIMNNTTIAIGLSDQQRNGVTTLLNFLLADEFVLYTKTLNYHWNIKGVHFGSLHAFFKDQYEQLLHITDSVAERIQTLDHHASSTLQEFLQRTRLQERTGTLSEKEMLQDLLQAHEAIIRTLREDIERCSNEYGDMGTNNFLTDIMEQHEKMAWMLRSHLQS